MSDYVTIDGAPEDIALVFGNRRVSYDEFTTRVTLLSVQLAELGVGADTAVAVSIPRSIELLVAIHAIIAAGGQYVPIDPATPTERASYMIETSGAGRMLIGRADQQPSFVDELRSVDYVGIDASTPYPRTASATGTMSVDIDHDNAMYTLFTSGSTGRPKGVSVSHRAVANRLQWMREWYAIKDSDVFLQKTPVTFDVSVWELFLPFMVGATLVIADPDRHGDADHLVSLIESERITTVHFVPSMLAAFVDSVGPTRGRLDSVRLLFASGEALPSSVAHEAMREFPRATVHNLYGPTEAAVDVTAHQVDPDEIVVPIGVPVPGTTTYVLDPWLQWVPEGVPGELYLGGVQVARGYSAQSALTAQRFVADPFGSPGARLYRTGDRVRWNASGELEYLGRNDFQVKLRGQRLELGEVEAALMTCAGVVHAAADVRMVGTQAHLVGYVAPSSVVVDDLAEAVARVLPEYMRPTVWVTLDEMPLNASGKIARAELPQPHLAVGEHVAPRGNVEAVLAEIFADVLGGEPVSVVENLFDLGGNSLSAMRIAARANESLGIRLSIRDVFAAGSVRALADMANSGGGLPQLTRAEPRPDSPPLSYAQQRMWFINRFDPSSNAYNIPLLMRLTGNLDVGALWNALSDVLERHEVLRTTFPAPAGVPTQRVHPATELSTMLDVAEVQSTDELERDVESGFDLAAQWPIRARLLRTGAAEYVVALVLHHIAADGESLRPLIAELALAYSARVRGEQPVLHPLDVQVVDHAIWQRESLGSPDDAHSLMGKQLAYWRRQLSGLPPVLSLPTDSPRPAVFTGRGDRCDFEIPREVATRIDALAQQCRVTPFMIVHAALATLLARLTAEDDIAIGTPIAGRDRPEIEPLIGMFVNTLVLRTRIDLTDSFLDLVEQVRRTDIDGYANSDVPFEMVVETVDPVRSEAFAPLAQVWLTFEGAATAEFADGHIDPTTVAGLEIAPMPAGSLAAKVDLLVGISRTPGEDWLGSIIYAADLFEAESVERVSTQLVDLLAGATAQPQTPLSDVIDRGLSGVGSVSGGDGTEPVLLADIFGRAAQQWPDSLAVVDDADNALTYAEIDRRSNRLARWLIDQGAGPETLVALSIRRSVTLLTAIWAVAKTGAAYVPVDPTYPPERIALMIEDSDAKFGLTTVDSLPHSDVHEWFTLDSIPIGAAIEDRSDSPLAPEQLSAQVRGDNAAYVIYTSGSTGRPKGVTVSHSGLANFGVEEIRRSDTDAPLRVLGFASPSFDASVLEYLLATMSGGTLYYRPEDAVGGESLQRFMAGRGVTHTFLTPSVLTTLDPDALPALRTVYVGGEAVGQALVDRWAPVRRMQNLYGPTETTIGVIIGEPMHAGRSVMLGGPLAGVDLVVLDQRLRPVADGVPGELYVGGHALSRGYLGRSGLTAARFVPNPLSEDGTRLYRTGDVVRWRHDGDHRVIEYLGRSDDQVKLRGLRLELGEIETVLAEYPGIRSAVVVGVGGAVVTDLAAYVTVDAEGEASSPTDRRGAVDIAALKSFAARRLPTFMIPSTVTVLDSFPLTPVGKLDRAALPRPAASTGDYEEPETDTERTVAAIFADVLDTSQVSATAGFFDLGGNSLSATRVVARVRDEFDVDFDLAVFFHNPTVRGLAAALESGARSAGGVMLPLREQGARPPLFCIHPAGGLAWFYGGLAPYLTDRPIYGIQDPYVVSGEHAGDDAHQIAAGYVEEIRRIRPHGPYHLLGWSVGGVLADAVATALQSDGETVEFLGIMDASPPANPDPPTCRVDSSAYGSDEEQSGAAGSVVADALGGWRDLFDLGEDVQASSPDEVAAIVRSQLSGMNLLDDAQVDRIMESFAASESVVAGFRPQTFTGDVLVFTATADKDDPSTVAAAWRPYVTGSVRNVDVDSHHLGLADESSLAVIGPALEAALDAARATRT